MTDSIIAPETQRRSATQRSENQTRTQRRREKLLPRIKFLLPPTIATAISGVFYTLIAYFSGENFFSTESHVRWDSLHYLSIADDGYAMHRCIDNDPNFPNPDAYCGNTGWFALYPMLMRISTALGLPLVTSGVLLSALGLWGCMIALWWLLGSRLTLNSALIMGIAAVFPGSIYFHAVFPMSIGTLGLLLILVGLRRDSWILAGAGGAIAGASHMMGNVGIGVLILSVFFAWRSFPWKERITKAAASTALGLTGFVWTSWLMWQVSGVWDTYFVVQSGSYGNGVYNPWGHFYKILSGGALWYPLPEDATALELASTYAPRYTLITVLIVLAACSVMVGVHAYQQWRRTPGLPLYQRGVASLSVTDWGALLIMGSVFLMPLVAGGMVTPYRNHVMILPALILLRNAPRVVNVAILGVCAWVAALLGAAFFSGVLV